MRLDRSSTVLVIIDVQERLMPVIDARENVESNIERLIRGAHILGLPVLVTEQYTKGLGPTVQRIRAALEEMDAYRPIEKDCFSAHACSPFAAQLESQHRRQVLLCGVETHVCVYQTATDLQSGGFEVSLVADAVSSRRAENKTIAIQRMAADGIRMTSVEMALFELCVRSGTDEFRALSRLLK